MVRTLLIGLTFILRKTASSLDRVGGLLEGRAWRMTAWVEERKRSLDG